MRSHLHEVPSILEVDDLPIAHHRARRESLARSNQVTRRRWSEICRERPSDAATVLGLDTGAGPRVTRCGASRNRAVDGTRPAVTDARASGGVNEPRSPPRLTSLGCCSLTAFVLLAQLTGVDYFIHTTNGARRYLRAGLLRLHRSYLTSHLSLKLVLNVQLFSRI